MKPKTILTPLLLSFLMITNSLNAFKNLSEINQFKENYEEYPNIDNNNYLKPDYSSYYKKIVPTGINYPIMKILDFIGLKKELWSADDFKNSLTNIINQRKKLGYNKNYIIKITPKQKTDFIIFGDLQGAFHSLARNLNELNQLKIINKEFEIIKPDTFLIFNGNVISKSPYIMETLTSVLNLMEKNPEKVFFIKGTHEINEGWVNLGLRKELRSKASYVSDEKIPLNTKINQFIDTLPLAVYIDYESKQKKDLIRISNFDRANKELDESYFYDFLKKDSQQQINIFDLSKKKYTDKLIEINAIIKGLDRTFKYHKTEGLEHLYPDKGATAWSIFSSPTLPNQKLYNFYNDAFAILKIKIDHDPIITLYKQSAEKPQGYARKTYNLLTEEILEKEEIQILDQKEIKTELETINIGTTLDLSAELADLGKNILAGMRTAINNYNKTSKFKIKLDALDNKYNPEIAQENIEMLLKKDVDIILTPVGSYPLEGYISYVKSNDILVLFPDATSPIFRTPDLKNIVHYFASSFNEAKILTNYLIKEMNIKKIAVFYQQDSVCNNAFQGASEIFKKYNLQEGEDWIAVSHRVKSLEMDAAIKEMRKFKPEAILLFSIQTPVKKLIEKLGSAFIFGKTIAGFSTLSGPEFAKFAKLRNFKFVSTLLTPDAKTSDLPIVKEYRNLTASPDQNNLSLEGFITASIFTDILNKIEGNITKEKILTTIESIKNYDFKGLKLNFNAQTRELGKNNVWIKKTDDQTILYTSEDGKEEIKVTKPKEEPNEKSKTDKQSIRIGTTMDLSAESADAGRNILAGMRLKIKDSNKTSNIKIKLISMDDKYNPNLAKENIETLLKQGIDILLTPVGSNQLNNYLPLIEDEKVLVLFPEATAYKFRRADLKYLIHYFASSKQDGKAIIDYMIKNIGLKKIALFYQPEAFSLSELAGAKEILAKNNCTEGIDWIAVSHPTNTIDVEDAVRETLKFMPEAIALLSVPTPSEKFIEKLGASFIVNKTILGAASCSGPEFKKFAKLRNIRYYCAQLAPSPKQLDLEIVKEFNEICEKYKFDPNNVFALEGFISSSIFIDILGKIDGTITKEKILKTIEAIKDYDFKGLKLNFNPKTREISKNNIWITDPNGKTITYEMPEDTDNQKAKPDKGFAEQDDTTKSTDVIKLGTTMDISSASSELGRNLLKGILLKIRHQNKGGGINGKIIKLNLKDDKYEPSQTKKNIEEFIEEGINIIPFSTGSFSFKEAIPFIKEGKISAFFPNANAPIFYNPNLKNIVNFLSQSFYEGKVLADYFVEKVKSEKVVLLHQTDIYSQDVLKAVKEVLEENNYASENILEITQKPHSIVSDEDIKKVKAFRPNAIFLISFYEPAQNFLKRLGIDFLIGKKVFGADVLSGPEFRNYINDKNINYTYVQTMPSLNNNLEITKEYIDIANQSGKQPNAFALKGYIISSIFIDLILKKIEGEITQQKLIEQAESIKNINYKGLPLNFDPMKRNIYHQMWLYTDKGEVIQTDIHKKVTQATGKEDKSEEKIKIKNEINIGTTMDISSASSELGRNLLKGIFLKIKQQNKSGGINGKIIKLNLKDDKYEPSQTKKNIEEFIEEGINIIPFSTGSFSFKEAIPFIKEGKISAFFPNANAPIFYNPNLKNIVNFISQSFYEGKVLADYFVEKVKSEKVVLLHQTDVYSQDVLKAVKEVLEENNYASENILEITQKPHSVVSDEDIKKVKAFRPNAIFLISFYEPAQNFLKRLGIDFLIGKKVFGADVLSSPEFRNYINDKNINYTYVQTMPSLNNNLEITKEYIDIANQSGKQPNAFALKGYIISSIFIDLILKKIEGEITQQKLIEQAESIKNINYKGLPLNFDPMKRNIYHQMWLYTDKGEVIQTDIHKKVTQAAGKEDKSEEKIKIKNEINIGTTMDTSSETGRSLLKGLFFKIREQNEAGGINGKNIKYEYKDDKYLPNLAKKNIEAFIQDNTRIFLSSVGSYTFAAAIPFIKEDEITAFFSDANAPIFYNPNLKNIINFMPSSFYEGTVLADYLIEKIKPGKIAILSQKEDLYSQGALDGVKETLRKNNYKDEDILEISNYPNDKVSNEDINKVKNFKPNAILLISFPKPSRNFLKRLGPGFLLNKQILGVDACSGLDFLTYIENNNLNYTYVQTMPNLDCNLEIVNEYKNIVSKAEEKPNPFGLKGFIISSIFIDLILKKIDGEITRSKLIKQAESIKNINYKGIHLNFDPMKRNIYQQMWLYTDKGEIIQTNIHKEITPTIEKKDKPEEKIKIKNEINIGTTMDTSFETGRSLLKGLFFKIREQNEAGGINGKNIKYEYKDDKYLPNLAKKNIEAFIQDNTRIFLSSVGSYTFAAAIPFIKEDEITAFFSDANAPIFYNPNLKNIINFMPSSFYEGTVLADYLIEKIKPGKIAILSQKEDLYSQGALDGAKETLRKNNYKDEDILEISNYPNDKVSNEDINKVKNFKPNAILLISFPKPSQNFLKRLGPGFLLNKQILGVDACSGSDFLTYIENNNLNYTYVQTMPNLDRNLEIVNEYKNIVSKAEEKPNPFGLKGFIISSIFIDLILKKIDGEITRSKLIKQAESIKNINYKGIKLNFDPNERNIYQTLWLYTNKNEVFEKNIQKTLATKKEDIKSITTKDEINIGTTMDFSAEIKDHGTSMLAGLNLRISKENRAGGIKGKKIKLTSFDDKYKPLIAKKNIEKLLQQNIDIILSPIGSYTLNGYLDIIKDKKIAVFFPRAISPIFRNPDYTNLIHFFPSSQEESEALTEYLLKKIPGKIAIFYQNEPYSQGALAGAEKILKANGLKEGTDWIKAGHAPNSIKIENAANKIIEFQPDTLLLLSVDIPTRTLIKKLGINFLYNRKLMGIVSNSEFENFMNKRKLKYIHTQFVPNLENDEIKILNEYKKEALKHNETVNRIGLEGYLTASLFIDLLKKIDGEITKEKILEQAKKIKDFDLDGLKLNFNPKTNSIATSLWLNLGHDKFEKKELRIFEKTPQIIKTDNSITENTFK